MVELGEKNEASEAVVNGFIFAFLCLLAMCLVMNHYIGHKLHPKYISEAGAVVLVGLIISLIVRFASHGEAKEWLRGISPTVFFIGFLPPIIFNSGYTLRRKVFLYYFTPIVLYAVVGTFMSSIFVGMVLFGLSQGHASYSMSMAECLAFGSLISSTDPVSVLAVFEQLKVEPLMFYLVFGVRFSPPTHPTHLPIHARKKTPTPPPMQPTKKHERCAFFFHPLQPPTTPTTGISAQRRGCPCPFQHLQLIRRRRIHRCLHGTSHPPTHPPTHL